MDRLEKRFVESATDRSVAKLGKPKGMYAECYVPLGSRTITPGVSVKTGLFYRGTARKEFRCWLEGTPTGSPTNFVMVTRFGWRRSKKCLGVLEAHVDCIGGQVTVRDFAHHPGMELDDFENTVG